MRERAEPRRPISRSGWEADLASGKVPAENIPPSVVVPPDLFSSPTAQPARERKEPGETRRTERAGEDLGDGWGDTFVPSPADDLSANSPVGLYLREISQHPLLKDWEEVELAKQREAGEEAREVLRHEMGRQGITNPKARKELEDWFKDPIDPSPVRVEDPDVQERLVATVRAGKAARKRLIESNLRLVVSVARKYMGRGLLFMDLIQEGNIGLQKGVEKYDWRRGFRFSTYAYWWIRQAVTRAVSDQARTIRLPVHITELLTRLYNTAREMHQELGREPTPEEIGNRVGMEPEKVREAFRAAKVPIPLETPVGEKEESELGDLIPDIGTFSPPDEEAEEKILSRMLEEALRKHLTGREAKVLRMRFGLEDGQIRTLGEVGDELEISRERARQIEAEAMKKLRKSVVFMRAFRAYVE